MNPFPIFSIRSDPTLARGESDPWRSPTNSSWRLAQERNLRGCTVRKGNQRMSARTGFGLILVLALGCGSGTKYVPVSGKVTLNGQPLADTIVSFEPIGSDESINNPALASAGKTNANGEYTLRTAKGANGAWVGKHRVKFAVVGPDTDERPSLRSRQRLTLPGKYTDASKEEYEVLPGGTDKADFALTSP
jgi:hypothetical protein